MENKKPNIIMILLDGGRFDSLKKVPSFNTWINKGALFSQMITYGPQTVTALHSLFSGINGNINGANNYYGCLNFKKKLCKTLPQYLQQVGYHTSANLLQDIILPKQGFDSITLHDEHTDDIVSVHTNLIKEQDKIRKQNKNFFLFLQYSPIHTNMIQNVVKKHNYDDFSKEYFNNKEENLKNYEASVMKADDYLNKILKLSEDLSLFEDTLFIIFSDHGASVGEKPGELGYGRFCYDYTIKSFVCFIHNNEFPKTEITKLCRLIDIFPTILDLLKIPESPNFLKIQGKSLIPLMNNEPDERFALSEAAGVEQKPTNTPPKLKSIRTRDWKLIYHTDTNENELYDIIKDPKEEQNLISSNLPKAKELFIKLRSLCPELEKINF